MIKKRNFIVLALCALAVAASMFLLTSCNSSETPSTSDTNADTTNTTPETPATNNTGSGTSSTGGGSATTTEQETFTISINRETDPLRRRDAHSGWICVDEEIMAAIAKDQGFKVKTTDTYKDPASAQAALSAGDVDGISCVTAADSNIAAYDLTDPTIEVDGVSYSIAVAKGENAEFVTKFNTGLANIKASGQLQEILDKYTEESTA